MYIGKIKKLLSESIGLNIETVGSSNFKRAVRQRMKVCQIDDESTYLMAINKSGAEMRELIEEVVIPETWFFRNQSAFTALGKYLKDEWLAKDHKGILRVLSIPCSTGEEPYSIAFTLDQMGLTNKEYHIDAIDISTRVLITAKRGIYGRNSFRNKDNSFRDRYFNKVDRTYVLPGAIKNLANFQQGNLLDRYFGAGRRRYDIIFCRNLLIYFDRSTQEKTIAKLSRMLNDDGLLFLGHAEIGDYVNSYYRRAGYPRAFAYKKISRGEQKRQPGNTRKEPIAPKGEKKVLKKYQQVAGGSNISDTSMEEKQSPVVPEIGLPGYNLPVGNEVLREVARLAGKGKFGEAGVLCENYLCKNANSAQAYYQLGLIREAEGNRDVVAELFQKAVFLDPNHHEAIMNLALYAGRDGDVKMAKELFERTQLVRKRRRN